MTAPDNANQSPAGNLIGKRYQCAQCGSELICVRGGSGAITCHATPMELLAPKPLPATD